MAEEKICLQLSDLNHVVIIWMITNIWSTWMCDRIHKFVFLDNSHSILIINSCTSVMVLKLCPHRKCGYCHIDVFYNLISPICCRQFIVGVLEGANYKHKRGPLYQINVGPIHASNRSAKARISNTPVPAIRVLRQRFSSRSRSIPRLLILLFLSQLDNQHPWHWINIIPFNKQYKSHLSRQ